MSTEDNSGNESDGVECPICGGNYKNRRGLGTHLGRIHGESLKEYERRTELNGDGASCPTCGKVFRKTQSMKSHHAQKHGESIAGFNKVCPACSNEFTTCHDDQVCCSHSCAVEHRDDPTGADHPSYKGEAILACEWCGSEYSVPKWKASRSKFCSMSCRAARTADTYNVCTRVTLVCNHCDSEYDVAEHRSNESRFCSRECLNQWQRDNPICGTENPNWNGGRSLYDSLLKQMPRAWTVARRETRKRDGRTCQMCGLHGAEHYRKLSVHHIVPVVSGGTNADFNLLTLCNSCHHRAEQYTRDLFDNLFAH